MRFITGVMKWMPRGSYATFWVKTNRKFVCILHNVAEYIGYDLQDARESTKERFERKLGYAQERDAM